MKSTHGSHLAMWRALSLGERVLVVALAAIALWLFYVVAVASATQNLLFDGAMNLEVSRSLVEGRGPRRLYDFNDYFPHGVQTKEPYLLVGALIFRVFGIGPVQAQLPNVLFLLLLCAVMLLVVWRTSGLVAALFALVLLLAMPMLLQYGLNGYGEIPAFSFGMGAFALICWPGDIDRRLWSRALLAGMLAGLAFATKTVAAILLVSGAITLAARIAVESRNRWSTLVRGSILYSVGIATPILLVEIWRLITLGHTGYIAWWNAELQGIAYQAGVTHHPSIGATFSKIKTHFTLLQAEIRRSTFATALLLAMPLCCLAGSLFRRGADSARMRWILLALGLVGGCYLIWWMAITPTEKAWLRRIYIGLICLGTITAICCAGWIRRAFQPGPWTIRITAAGGVLAVALIYGPFVLRNISLPSAKQTEEVRLTLQAADIVRGMGPDQLVFAYGWYAAPTVALHSGRQFIDLTDWPIGRYPGYRTYIVADRATFVVGMLKPILERYPHRGLMPANDYVQIYEVDMSKPNSPFDSVAQTLPTHVTFSESDGVPVSGMQPYDEGMRGRWIESDSEILLSYDGQSHLHLAAYMAPQSYYRFGVPLTGRLEIAGCDALQFEFIGAGWIERDFPLEDCTLSKGQSVRIRILLDNTFDQPLVYDHQRAMLLQSIGFE